MSKILLKLICFLIALSLNLFFSVNVSYAAVCGDPSLGITYDPERFVSGSNITLNFHLSNPNTISAIKYVRLRFGSAGIGAFGDTYIPDPRNPTTANGQEVTSTNFSITISNSNLQNRGNHPGELQWTQTPGGSFEHNSCPITYRVDPAPSICQLDATLKDQYQPNSPITVQFGGIPNTKYYLFLLIRERLGYRSGTRYPVAETTTNTQGQGVFNGIRLRGDQGDQIQLLIDVQQDPAKATNVSCGKSITLTIAASAPQSICYFKKLEAPAGHYGVRAINLTQNTTYFSELDGQYNFVAGNLTTDANSTELTFDLGTEPPPGNHRASVKDLSAKEMCSDDLTVSADGSTTSTGPEPPGGPVSAPTPAPTACTDPTTCTLAGGDPCGDSSNPGFKTAIGCIHTKPIEFTKDALKFIIGIGGGLAFLMMLLGAFQMLTSAGNPETLQAGRDRLTSAIIGLLFVIFAVLLMQIIGVDILGLPGFVK